MSQDKTTTTLHPILGHDSPVAMNRVYRLARLNPGSMRMKVHRGGALTDAERRAIVRVLKRVVKNTEDVITNLQAKPNQ